MNHLGKYLKKRLKELKMSEREISAKCGISHSYLNQLIKGINPSTNKNISPTLNTFEKLSAGFDVPIDYLQKIARGCVEDCLDYNGSKIKESKLASYSPELIKQINDFQIFMKEIGLDKNLKTNDEWREIIEKLKELVQKNYTH